MNERARRVRGYQIGMLLLLSVAVAQVLWWLIDQANFTLITQQRVIEGLQVEEQVARELDRLGVGAERIRELLPQIEITDAGPRLRPSALADPELERSRHLNQYGWEGTFFLLVLLVGMGVLWRALRQESELRHRQQNFLAAVSHELKSPLASLRLGAETMTARELSAEQRRVWLERCLGDVGRLENLVSNLLDTSRLESERVDLCRETVYLHALAETLTAELVSRFEGEGVNPGPARVDNRIPADLVIEADPVAAATVLRNLIENALRATSDGGEVVLEGAEGADGVEVVVADSGVGFDPAETDRLFEKFYRPGDELTRRSQGTGLGLYLVRRFMELQGGRVAAASAGPGSGARFVVSWPTR